MVCSVWAELSSLCQMLNGVDYHSSAGVWAQDKWKGQFKVKWIYVKDVPNNQVIIFFLSHSPRQI